MGIGGALAAGGSIAGAAIGSHGATQAAKTQANAADAAAQLQYQQSQDALNFQKQVYGQGQQNIAPWLQSGTGALASLDTLLGIPVGGFDANSSFANDLSRNPGASLVNSDLRYTYPNSPAYSGLGSQPVTQPQYNALPAQTQVPNPAANIAANPGIARTSIGTNAAGFRGTNTLNNRITSGVQPATAAPTSDIQRAIGLNPGGTPAPAAGAPGAAGQPVSMSNLLGGTPTAGGLLQGWNQQFQAPTNVTEQNDPGYQFRLNQGLQALQNSAAARGGLLSGNTAQAINDYAQQSASNEYGNVYNRALGEYQQNYNIYNQNQANQYNRLANLAGIGQTAAGQLNSAGQSAAGNIGNILLNSGQQIGQDYQNAGAATASGYVGSANAIGGGLQGLTGSIGQYLTLNSLLGGGGSGGGGGFGGYGGIYSPTPGYFNPEGS